MEKIKKQELRKIEGGTSVGWIAVAIGIVIALLGGILDGYTNPEVCNG